MHAVCTHDTTSNGKSNENFRITSNYGILLTWVSIHFILCCRWCDNPSMWSDVEIFRVLLNTYTNVHRHVHTAIGKSFTHTHRDGGRERERYDGAQKNKRATQRQRRWRRWWWQRRWRCRRQESTHNSFFFFFFYFCCFLQMNVDFSYIREVYVCANE